MKIYTKILLITLPLIVIPTVVVSLISYQFYRSEIQTMAQDTLSSHLTNAMDICSRQASTEQTAGGNPPVTEANAKAAAVQELQEATFRETGTSIAVDASGFLVAHPSQQYIGQNIGGEAWFTDMLNQNAGSFTYVWEGNKRLAQFQRFQDWGWYVITSESESELLGPVNNLRNYIGGLLAISLFLAFITIFILARRLTSPLRSLISGTEGIRRGEPISPINVKTNDEIGALASAFNNMISQLQEVIGSLERRVLERTQDLEKRAVQMETASEIAKEAVSTHDLDTLLDQSVNLIQVRFNLYYASIYTPDEQRQYAMLRSGSGDVGQAMVQRGHRVRIGDAGIVSHVFGNGEARVINDVKTDFAYVKHPLLPDTACAAALPLKVGEIVVGVLEVESQHVNAFPQDMISALQTLADQMSVAIENTRLLDELRSSLRETRTLNQRYTQESWSGSAKKATTSGYQFDLSQISPYTRDLPEEIRTQLQAGRAIPVTNRQLKISTEESNGKTGQHSDGNRDGNRSILIAPLILYDRLIGVLGVEEDNPNHKWSSEEIALLEAISNQVSLTLDNARLVEETQLRSEQIRLLQEITAEAASHVKLNELLEAVTQRLLTGYNLSQCGIAMLDTVPGSGDEPGDERQSSGRQPAKTSTMLAYTSAPGMPGPNLKGSKIPIDEDGLAKKVLDTHKAIVVHDKPHPTMLMAPLLTRGESFGMITMEITDPERQFNEDDLRLLEQIGLQISAAIEVARNFEQTANRAEYERLIGDMTSRIRETLDVETMVKTAVKEVQQALKLPEVVIRLGLPTKRESAPDSTESGLTTPLTGEIE